MIPIPQSKILEIYYLKVTLTPLTLTPLTPLGVRVEEKNIQACHRLKNHDRAIIKLINRKHIPKVLYVKKYIRSLEPTEFDFPDGTRIFINESICAYYRGLWNKCKKLKGASTLDVLFVSNGTIKSRY